MDITEKLEMIKHRWEEMGEQLADPAVASDMKKFVKLNKDYKDLEPIVMAFKEYKTLKANVEEAREILATEKDEEMRKMAQEELDTAHRPNAHRAVGAGHPRDDDSQRPARQQERHHGNPCGHRRRRSLPLCRRPVPNVQQVLRKPWLESGNNLRQRRRERRLQGN